jgi:hypothetical protein
MTRKRLAWVCLIVTPLVLGGAAFCLSDRDPITQANCAKIKPGMTEKEVETLLGRKEDQVCYCCWGPSFHMWKGSRGTISVCMQEMADPDVVESASFSPSEPRPILEKIRKWLGW